MYDRRDMTYSRSVGTMYHFNVLLMIISKT